MGAWIRADSTFFDIEGDSYDDAYNKLMDEPLFDGEALKDILDKIEWLEC